VSQTDHADEGYVLPPWLLDGALQAFVVMRSENAEGEMYLPSEILSAAVFGRVPSRVWAHLLVSTQSDAEITGQVNFHDEHGARVAAVSGIRFRRVPEGVQKRMASALYAGWAHRVAWVERPGSQSDVKPAPGRYAILADEQGIGEALARLLRDAGSACVCIHTGPRALHDSAESLDEVRELERELSMAFESRGPTHVLNLWPLSAEDRHSATPEDVLIRQKAAVQALFSAARLKDAREIWTVTRGAKAVTEAENAALRPEQAMLWGLVAGIAAEQLLRGYFCVDLQAASAEDAARALGSELTANDGEKQVAVRGNSRFVPRLVPHTIELSSSRLDGNATYIVSGGAGALGREAARALVNSGARHVVLLGRRAPGNEHSQLKAAFERQAATLEYVSVDVSHRPGLEAALHRVSAERPVKGVVHAAGVLDDSLVELQSWQRLAGVLAPKAVGALLLDELLSDQRLDFFICYSSVAGLIGSPCQSPYCAANAFLDAWALKRTADGRATLSLQWGPWRDAGMAAVSSDVFRERIGQFMGWITPAHGRRLLQGMLPHVRGSVALAKFHLANAAPARPALLRDLRDDTAAEPREHKPTLLFTEGATREEQQRHVLDVLQKLLSVIMGHQQTASFDPHSPLAKLGLDSLMTVELRTRLQVDFGLQVSVESLLTESTLSSLAEALLAHGSSAVTATATLQRDEARLASDSAPGPDTFKFELFPEMVQLRQAMSAADLTADDNPYFICHDAVARETTRIGGRELLNFSSYNYLGNSGDPSVVASVQRAVERYGTSVSASRVAAGERPIHRELEQSIAEFLGVEACVVMVGGYSTNVTTIGTLLGPDDLILHDALIHSSALSGARLSGAKRLAFPHNDWAALDDILRAARRTARRALVLIEGAYSMDGDTPELSRFVEVSKRHAALLMVDEAHSIGTLGASGRGIAEHCGVDPRQVDIWMGTLSKSLASCGGYIAGSQALIELLKCTAPGFTYSVGLSPADTAAALTALQLLKREPERVRVLQQRAAFFVDACTAEGLDTGTSSGTPIVPVIVGDSQRAMRLAQAVYRRGINVQPMVFPAVEDSAARLRFFISYLHTEEQLLRAARATAEELRSLISMPHARPSTVSL
jgi:8-amino-7-oxononanoate synthase